MSACRKQALINAPPSAVWDLVGDPRRHSEWWPRVVEVRGERFDEGSNFAQVTKTPRGRSETTMVIDRLDDFSEIQLRCLNTGTIARWRMTEAQGNTFVDVEFGIEPIGLSKRVLDAAIGKIYFRRWAEQSLAALEAAVATSESHPTARGS